MNQSTRDILSNPWLAGAVFCLPAAVIVLSGNLSIGNLWQAGIWAFCLSVVAAGCFRKRSSLRANALLFHRSVSATDGAREPVLRFWIATAWGQWLELDQWGNPLRRRPTGLCSRTSLRQVSATLTSQVTEEGLTRFFPAGRC